MHRHRFLIILLLIPTFLLQGCAAMVLAGGATAVVAAKDRRTVGAMFDDQAIETKAGNAMRDDPELKGQVHINVTSLNGVVLLTGEAPTSEQRDAVVAAIRRIPGVRRTVNEIREAPVSSVTERANDTWITGKVKSKMATVENVDRAQIKVITENSVVYLMGLLTQDEAERATAAVTEVGGITRVVKLFEYIDDVIDGKNNP
jgi:osmotically-inducible protein OsmY